MFFDKGYPKETIGNVVDRKITRIAKKYSPEDEIEYLDISSIDNTTKTVTGTTRYTVSKAPSRAQYILDKGDILYSTVRPNLKNIAINPFQGENIIGSTGFCVLRCTRVAPGFLWGLITSDPFTEKMCSLASGTNYPAVTDSIVYGYEFPLPPIDEQTRFEAIIQQSDKSKLSIENSTNNQEETECLQKLILKKWSARP